jgi:hypothetical protein
MSGLHRKINQGSTSSCGIALSSSSSWREAAYMGPCQKSTGHTLRSVVHRGAGRMGRARAQVVSFSKCESVREHKHSKALPSATLTPCMEETCTVEAARNELLLHGCNEYMEIESSRCLKFVLFVRLHRK